MMRFLPMIIQPMTLRIALNTAVVASMVMLANVWINTPANANDLIVSYDQSQLLKLPRPVGSIIVGNPSIADVAVQDGDLLIVTGKTFGVTNVIALDRDRNIIQDQRIIVRQDTGRTVTLTKGSARESYACTPHCSSMLSIGDSREYFDMIAQHGATKTQFSLSGNAGQQNQGN